MTILSAGESYDITATKVRMGIGWDSDTGAGLARTGRPPVDLDATALEYAGKQLFDLAFYNNLSTRDGAVVHQGDNDTGAGDGDDETVLVDLAKVHGPVDTIVFLVSSYQGHSLEWVAGAYCRLLDDESGEELARFTLTLGAVKDTGCVLAVLRRSPGGWALHAVGEGAAITKPTEGLVKLTRFVS